MREFEIRLDNVNIFAYHGVFEEERIKGNDFIVNLRIKYNAPEDFSAHEDNLQKTVCYASLYDIIKEEMKIPRNLLESVAISIVNKISSSYSGLSYIECSITKLNPPIEDFKGSATVKYTFTV